MIRSRWEGQVVVLAAWAMSGCATFTVPIPQRPDPSELQFEWRGEPAPLAASYHFRDGAPQEHGQLSFRLVEPDLEGFKCVLPTGTTAVFDPMRYGLLLQVRNRSQSIWSGEGERSDVVLEAEGKALPVQINPLRRALIAFLGMRGAEPVLREAREWHGKYQDMKGEKIDGVADARQSGGSTEAARNTEPSDERQEQKGKQSGGILDSLFTSATAAFGNPAVSQLLEEVDATFSRFEWRAVEELPEYQRFILQMGEYTRKRREFLEGEGAFAGIADDVVPDRIVADVNAAYVSRRKELAESGEDVLKGLRMSCERRIRQSLSRYAEWPQRVLPGYSMEFFLPLVPSSELSTAKSLALVLFGMPVSFAPDGTESARRNITFPLSIGKPRELPAAPGVRSAQP